MIDIVDELIPYYRAHHDCEPVLGEFNAAMFEDGQFDLVIFRDLLEHVRNPFLFLQNVNQVLALNGRAFFITPNGKEDFWMINQRFLKTRGRSLLLLNHFHYFLPETLERMLKDSGFSVEKGFKFGLKQHRKGLGWKDFTEFDNPTVPGLPDGRTPTSVHEVWKHEPAEVRNRLLSNLGALSRIYSGFADSERERTPFVSPKGHEFFVLAEKQLPLGSDA